MSCYWCSYPAKEVGEECFGMEPKFVRRWVGKGNSLYTWQLLVSMLDFCGLISQIPQSAELFGVSFVKNHSSLVSTT